MRSARAHCAVESRLLEFLRSRGLEPSAPLAVAYSGGPDSTALLAALCALRKGADTPVPLAIHVDHGIRPHHELEAELELVRSTCLELGARLAVAHVRFGAVAAEAARSGEGVEAAARRYRYSAFRSILAKSGSQALLLAHNRGDQLETLLMRMLGGAGTAGLRGIPEASGPYLRPMLGLEKSELLDYLSEKGIRYSVDSTNESNDYLRNRIRHELLPALDSSFPGWRSGLERAAAKARLDEDALSAAASVLSFSTQDGSVFSTAAEPFLSAPEALSLRALVDAGARCGGKARVSYDWAAAAIKALKSGEGKVYRGSGLELRRQGERIELRRGLDFPTAHGYFVLIDRPKRERVGKLEVSAKWREAADLAGRQPGIRADAFSFPLVVRSRRPGDSIALPGGTKRLDLLFSEWALPEASRGRVPIVEDRDGIVAVLGSRLGGSDRYRRGPSGSCDRLLMVSVKGA
jgi:tRNA(Ile)-lysidine synthetase, N-terminal domain/tRNA(Ile)-lysidine synthetase, C-terminal domain